MTVSSTVRGRLETQGWCRLNDATLRKLAPWLRWTYTVGLLVTIIGVALMSPAVLWSRAGITFFGISFVPPFDLLTITIRYDGRRARNRGRSDDSSSPSRPSGWPQPVRTSTSAMASRGSTAPLPPHPPTHAILAPVQAGRVFTVTDVDLVPLVDDGLGNSAYLVDLGDGRALVVDVSRDLRAVHAAAAKRGLTVAFAADTHLHADFLSGAVQLASTSGTRILASAAGDREFAHTGLRDGDEVDLGGLRLRALTTPGHTHEHLAFLLLDGDREIGVFTGGSLLVGSAARTDLVSDDRTEELTRAQYASLRRLAALPGDVNVWPTHGAGSFCSAPPGSDRTSTIARELATNPLLQSHRRGRLRRPASRLTGQLSALLPPAR